MFVNYLYYTRQPGPATPLSYTYSYSAYSSAEQRTCQDAMETKPLGIYLHQLPTRKMGLAVSGGASQEGLGCRRIPGGISAYLAISHCISLNPALYPAISRRGYRKKFRPE